MEIAIKDIMRVAIAFWQNCISPVFDVSESILLIDVVNNQVTQSEIINVEPDLPFKRAKKLSDVGAEVLICGAISRSHAMAVWGQNIEIISYVFGPMEEILRSYINGQLQDGCGGQQKRKRHRRGKRN